MNLSQLLNPRQRRVHGDPSRNPLRKSRSEGIADHIANVVSHQIGLRHLELV